MTTDSVRQNRNDTAERSSGETVMGFAVLGLFGAGVAGLLQAMNMTRGEDVLLCLLGSVVAFGSVIYIYAGRR